ncbi:MAG: hypothetical protein ACYDDF_13455 [Thermoplasmatota archaeon]
MQVAVVCAAGIPDKLGISGASSVKVYFLHLGDRRPLISEDAVLQFEVEASA